MAVCPPTYHGYADLLTILKRIVAGGTANGTIVNVGARLPHGKWDADDAWDLLQKVPEEQFRMVAFEGNNESFARLKAQFPMRQTRVKLVHQFVSSAGIAKELRQRGVPLSFPLLKIDIDSIDMPIARAILLAGFRPHVIVAEFNQWVPLPIEFSALEPLEGERFRPSFSAGFRGNNRVLPCAGASLASWATFAHEMNYTIMQLDKPPSNANVLMVRTSAFEQHYRQQYRSDMACHHNTSGAWGMFRLIPNAEYERMSKTHHFALTRTTPYGYLFKNGTWVPNPKPIEAFDFEPATRTIDTTCRFSQTPYTLRINGGVCCPLNTSDSILCRAGCAPLDEAPGTVRRPPATAPEHSAHELREWLRAVKPGLFADGRSPI